MTYFIEEVNQSLAKPPLKFNGGISNGSISIEVLVNCVYFLCKIGHWSEVNW